VTVPVRFFPAEREIFRKPPWVRTFDWTRTKLRMPSGPGAGRLWDPVVTPYAEGVMDAWDHPRVETVYLMGPSQWTSKSTIMHACLLAELARKLAPIGLGMATWDQLSRKFEEAIHRYILQVPALREQLHPDPRKALQTDMVLWRGGDALFGMWAGSGPSWSSMSMKFVGIDEEDDYEDRMAVYGMIERVAAYLALGQAKVFRASKVRGMEKQPGAKSSEGCSTIYTDAKAQAHAWFRRLAHCPFCGTDQVMEHAHIVPVEPGNHDPRQIRERLLGRYRCPHCGNLWSDAMRDLAIRKGKWFCAELDMELDAWLAGPASESRGRLAVAFQICSWETTACSLSRVLADWFEAAHDPVKLQNFDNNHASIPYRTVVKEATESDLRRLVLPGHLRRVCPAETLALTCGIDMQKRGFWFMVLAWARDMTSWLVDWGRLATWADVETLVFDTAYPVDGQDGARAPIWRAAIDTGGGESEEEEWSKTAEVMAWLQLNMLRGPVFGVKGSSRRMDVPVRATTWGSNPGEKRQVQAWQGMVAGYMIDTHPLKDQLHYAMARDSKAPMFLSEDMEPSEAARLYRHLTSEKKRIIKGKETWAADSRANHLLDCAVYNRAAASPFWTPSLQLLNQPYLITEIDPSQFVSRPDSRIAGRRRSLHG
jgi:phage terminase large subunit GpA-like protein